MKRKKLYYLPGLISLLGLPVLLLLLFPFHEERAQQKVLRLFVPNDQMDKDGIYHFSKYYVYKAIKKKKITTINFGNLLRCQENYIIEAKLDFIKREIERMQFTNDATSVLKIEFGDESTYGDFIWILNQCYLYNVKRYALVDNTFYIFGNDPD